MPLPVVQFGAGGQKTDWSNLGNLFGKVNEGFEAATKPHLVAQEYLNRILQNKLSRQQIKESEGRLTLLPHQQEELQQRAKLHGAQASQAEQDVALMQYALGGEFGGANGQEANVGNAARQQGYGIPNQNVAPYQAAAERQEIPGVSRELLRLGLLNKRLGYPMEEYKEEVKTKHEVPREAAKERNRQEIQTEFEVPREATKNLNKAQIEERYEDIKKNREEIRNHESLNLNYQGIGNLLKKYPEQVKSLIGRLRGRSWTWGEDKNYIEGQLDTLINNIVVDRGQDIKGQNIGIINKLASATKPSKTDNDFNVFEGKLIASHAINQAMADCRRIYINLLQTTNMTQDEAGKEAERLTDLNKVTENLQKEYGRKRFFRNKKTGEEYAVPMFDFEKIDDITKRPGFEEYSNG